MVLKFFEFLIIFTIFEKTWFCLKIENGGERTKYTTNNSKTYNCLNPKTMQQINFAEIINRSEDVNDNSTMFFVIEQAKETTLDLSQKVGKYCNFIFFCYDINEKWLNITL